MIRSSAAEQAQAMAKNKRLYRLLEIILLVQSRPNWRSKKRSEHFDIFKTIAPSTARTT